MTSSTGTARRRLPHRHHLHPPTATTFHVRSKKLHLIQVKKLLQYCYIISATPDYYSTSYHLIHIGTGLSALTVGSIVSELLGSFSSVRKAQAGLAGGTTSALFLCLIARVFRHDKILYPRNDNNNNNNRVTHLLGENLSLTRFIWSYF